MSVAQELEGFFVRAAVFAPSWPAPLISRSDFTRANQFVPGCNVPIVAGWLTLPSSYLWAAPPFTFRYDMKLEGVGAKCP